MGTFRLGCKIQPIADRSKSAKVEKLLVDTGSDYTWLPTNVLEKLGIQREKKDIRLTMANGTQITRSVGFVLIYVDKFFTGTRWFSPSRAICCCSERGRWKVSTPAWTRGSGKGDITHL